jgi:hypothetical protein
LLQADKNKISDISVLGNLTELEVVHLGNNDIKDVSVLGRLRKLRVLGIESNRVTDISSLGLLPEMKFFTASDNAIKDISVLSQLKELKEVRLANNKVRSIHELTKLRNLSWLELDGNRLNYFSYYRDLPSIEKNNPGLTKVNFFKRSWLSELKSRIPFLGKILRTRRPTFPGVSYDPVPRWYRALRGFEIGLLISIVIVGTALLFLVIRRQYLCWRGISVG